MEDFFGLALFGEDLVEDFGGEVYFVMVTGDDGVGWLGGVGVHGMNLLFYLPYTSKLKFGLKFKLFLDLILGVVLDGGEW